MTFIKILSGLVLCLLFVSATSSASAQDSDSEKILINKRPLQDLGERATSAIDKGADLNASFLVELSGQFGKDGKIDFKTARFTRTEGDERMIDLAKNAIVAISDAGYFAYVRNIVGNQFIVQVSQNNSNVSFEIGSEFGSESKAKERQSTISVFVALVKHQKNRGPLTSDDKDDLTLLESVSAVAEGKKLIIRAVLPKLIVQDMIKRRIATK
jgi:hypothetical protein